MKLYIEGTDEEESDEVDAGVLPSIEVGELLTGNKLE